MRTGLIISLSLHAAVLMWALAELPSARESPSAEMPLPVDIVSIEDFTRIKAGMRDGEPDRPAVAETPEESPSDAREEAERDRRAAAPPPAPAPMPAQTEPEPAAEPEPAEIAETEPEPKPEPEPEPQTAESAPPPPTPRRAPPQPRTAETRVSPVEEPARERQEPARAQAQTETAQRQQDFDADRIAALLDRAPDAGPQRTAASEPLPVPDTPPARGRAHGQDQTLAMSEIDALRHRISQCWIPPVGGMGAQSIRVSLRLRLDTDGTLLRQPEVTNYENSPFFQAAADSAVRAVWQCQPYELPREKYAAWRDMVLNFDPREMFGG